MELRNLQQWRGVLVGYTRTFFSTFKTTPVVVSFLSTGLVFYGLWDVFGNYRAEQVHREMTSKVSGLERDLAKADREKDELKDNLNSNIKSLEEKTKDLQNKLEAETEKLRGANNQVADLRQQLKELDTKRIQEANVEKSGRTRAEASLKDVQQQIEGLQQNLGQSRFPLVLYAETKLDWSDTNIFMKNVGGDPVRIVYKRFQVWINGRPLNNYQANTGEVMLRPEKSINIQSFKNYPGRPSPANRGVGDAICVLYESVANPNLRWITELWLAYLEPGVIDISKDDTRPAKKREKECLLLNREPKDWHKRFSSE